MVVTKTEDEEHQGLFSTFSQKGTITMLSGSKTIVTKKKLKGPSSPYSVTEVEGQDYFAPKFRYGNKYGNDESTSSVSENLFDFDEWKSKFPTMNLNNILEQISSGSLGCLCGKEMFQSLSKKTEMNEDQEKIDILSLTPSDVEDVTKCLETGSKNAVANLSGVDHNAHDNYRTSNKGASTPPKNEENVTVKKERNKTAKIKKNKVIDTNGSVSTENKNDFHSKEENLIKVSTSPIEDEDDIFKYFMFEPQQPESASFYLDDDDDNASLCSEINKIGRPMQHATSLNQGEKGNDLFRLEGSDFDKENFESTRNTTQKKYPSNKQINHPNRNTTETNKSHGETGWKADANKRQPKNARVSEIVQSNYLKSCRPDEDKRNEELSAGKTPELKTHKTLPNPYEIALEKTSTLHRERKLKNGADKSKSIHDSKGRKKFDQHTFFQKVRKNAAERLAKDPGFVNGCCTNKECDDTSTVMDLADDFVMTTFKRLPSDD